MGATGVDYSPPVYGSDQEKTAPAAEFRPESISSGQKRDVHRKLKSRHIQLIGIGGTIGTALYVRDQQDSLSLLAP